MTDKNEFENNKTDFLASAAKSTLGIVPFAGPLLAELVGTVIPNQRIDRLTKYIKKLDEKISKIPVEKINHLMENEEFIDLIEEGFVQASRAITEERRTYIASIISNGITDESINLLESKYLLKILQELNDIEVIWLRYYIDPTMGGDNEFREKHENVLTRHRTYLGVDEETRQKVALQENYKKHLERLGLIKNKYKFDRKSGVPEFDKFTGEAKISYSETSSLGKILLSRIDLN